MAFSRNGAAFVAINRDSHNDWSATLQTGLAAGTYCNVIVSDEMSSCATVAVGSDGKAQVTVPSMSAVAIHIHKKK
ncbi:hypothetical protein EON65_34045 [archaeon]|nr:MAG: hypothetical protein EON65_34045 [archaeon]